MTMERRHRWLALIVLCMGDLMIVLDTTIVNVALPSIKDSLGFSEASLAWVVNAYMLTFGGFMLLGGRLGDLFGHRRLFVAGIGALHRRLAGVRHGRVAGDARRRARRAGPRRRDRRGRGAVADHDALHRAGRAREGDGRDRLRRRGRRQRRRHARRRAHRRARVALDLPRQRARRDRRRRRELAVLPGGRVAGASQPARRRRRGDDHRGARARRLRDRERQRGRLDVGADARPAGRVGRARHRLPRDRVAGRLAARAAAALPAPECRDRERGRRALVGGDVRVVLPLGALPAAGARLHLARGRSGVPAGDADHGARSRSACRRGS